MQYRKCKSRKAITISVSLKSFGLVEGVEPGKSG